MKQNENTIPCSIRPLDGLSWILIIEQMLELTTEIIFKIIRVVVKLIKQFLV